MQWISIITALFGSGVLVSIAGVLTKLYKKIDANEKGTQALLRDRLYHIYYKYKKLQYRTPHCSENFENIYQQYHALGKNGVMDDIRKDFFEIELKEVD